MNFWKEYTLSWRNWTGKNLQCDVSYCRWSATVVKLAIGILSPLTHSPYAERNRRSGRQHPMSTRRMVALYDYDPRESSPNVDVEVLSVCAWSSVLVTPFYVQYIIVRAPNFFFCKFIWHVFSDLTGFVFQQYGFLIFWYSANRLLSTSDQCL